MKINFLHKVAMKATFAERQQMFELANGIEGRTVNGSYFTNRQRRSVNDRFDVVIANELRITAGNLSDVEGKTEFLFIDQFCPRLFAALASMTETNSGFITGAVLMTRPDVKGPSTPMFRIVDQLGPDVFRLERIVDGASFHFDLDTLHKVFRRATFDEIIDRFLDTGATLYRGDSVILSRVLGEDLDDEFHLIDEVRFGCPIAMKMNREQFDTVRNDLEELGYHLTFARVDGEVILFDGTSFRLDRLSRYVRENGPIASTFNADLLLKAASQSYYVRHPETPIPGQIYRLTDEVTVGPSFVVQVVEVKKDTVILYHFGTRLTSEDSEAILRDHYRLITAEELLLFFPIQRPENTVIDQEGHLTFDDGTVVTVKVPKGASLTGFTIRPEDNFGID